MGYVLIHGGATTGGYWDRLVPLLDGPAIAPDLPGRRDTPGDLGTLTVDEAAASVARSVIAAGLAGPCTVVAHSSGGLLVPGVIGHLGVDRLRAIVLNAASVPPEGGNGFDCMQARHRDLARQALAGAEASGTTIVTPKPDAETMRSSSGEELDDDQWRFMTAPERCVEDSFTVYASAVRWSRVRVVPVTYVVNLRDRAVPVELQREMAGRLPNPVSIVDLDSGHLAAVTRPDELAATIRRAHAEARPAS